MAVGKLRYNDYGIVHARIVAGTALELVNILNSSNIVFTIMLLFTYFFTTLAILPIEYSTSL